MQHKDCKRCTVVYLDDEPDLCDIFKDSLEDLGLELVTYTDPEKFLENIDSHNPHLIFLDYRMPGISGDQIAQRLKPAYKKALITGDLSDNLETHFLEVFRKPVDYAEIARFITRSLKI